jgi:hypothetical protein
MTFFYELNQRMAKLAAKQDAMQTAKEVKSAAPRSQLAEALEESEKWIQKAVNPKTKGNLHKALHVPQGETIPKAKIAKATHSKNPKLRHMAQFAKNVAKEDMADEGNEFTGNLAKAKAQHKDEFEVDGKKYKVVEADPTGLGEEETDEGAIGGGLGALAGGLLGGPMGAIAGGAMGGSMEEEEMAMDEGFAEMDAWLASREKEKGTGRFDKKKTSTGTVYTRKSETFDDPETDPEATGGAPKRVGRPKSAKPKDTERVTKGSHKYKTVDGKRIKKDKEAHGKMHEDENNDNMSIEQACAFLERHGYTVTKTGVDEEKAAQGQKKFFGMAHAAKTVNKAVNNIVKGRKETVDEESTDKEDTRAEKAGRKVAKDIEHDEGHKGQDDDRAEKAGKKVVKDIEYDDKKDRKEKKTEGAKPDFLDVDKDGNKKEPFKKAVKDKEEKVDETTTAGSVATAPAAAKSTKGMQFGKGVYESINTKIEGMIAESMNITVNMSTDEHGEPHKSVTVTADGDDADKLAELLKMAGLGGQSHAATCDACGQTPCGCAEVVDENKPDWPTKPEYTQTKQSADPISNDLLRDKSTGQTTIPVVASQLRRQVSMEENVELERSLFKTWKNYKG